MQCITLVLEPATTIGTLLAQLEEPWGTKQGEGERWLIRNAELGHGWIEPVNDEESHFSSEETEAIARLVENPVYYAVEFSDIGFGNLLLLEVLRNTPGWVDDDHNPLWKADEFHARLLDDPAWDWRIPGRS